MKYKNIKICHITEASSGGVFTHLSQISNYMDDIEQTFVFSSVKNPALRKCDSFNHNPLVLIDMKREINLVEDVKSLIRLYRFLKKKDFDIIHCHSSKAGVLGRIAAILVGKKVVYTPHSFAFFSNDSFFKKILYVFIEKIMAYAAAKIICVSKGEYSLALRWKIATNKKMIVIKNGVEMNKEKPTELQKLDWLRCRGLQRDVKVIGFSGRLTRQKNPEMLIKACGKMKYNNFVLVLLGDGDLRESLEDLVDSLGLENKVIFLGEVSDVFTILGYLDLFVSTSLWEAMPYSILEAISVDVPVVATNIAGVNELIIDGETGVLVPANDSDNLSEVLDMFLSNSFADDFDKYAKRAKELVDNQYSVDGMMNQLELVYKKVLDC